MEHTRTPLDLLNDINAVNTVLKKSIDKYRKEIIPGAKVLSIYQSYGIKFFNLLEDRTFVWEPGMHFPHCSPYNNKSSDAIHYFALPSLNSATYHLKWTIISQLMDIKNDTMDRLRSSVRTGQKCDEYDDVLENIYTYLTTGIEYLQRLHRVAICCRTTEEHLSLHVAEDEFVQQLSALWKPLCFTVLSSIILYNESPVYFNRTMLDIGEPMHGIIITLEHNYRELMRKYGAELQGKLKSGYGLPVPSDANWEHGNF